MKYVGSLESYHALLDDARAYDDVLIAMEGEADAARIMALEAKRKSHA